MAVGETAQSELSQLENLCEIFYGGGTPAQQKQAHDVLLPIVCDPTAVPQLQLVLGQSQNQSALIFAASGLMKLVTTCWNRISEVEKDDTRKFLLNYLYNNAQQLLQAQSPTLLQSLIRLLCRIVKLGWLERFKNQNITEQVDTFLEAGSAAHWAVGLAIYTALIEDIHPVAGQKFARLRRIAMSFREIALTTIFRTAFKTLRQVHSNALPFSSPDEELLLLRHVLKLTLGCLSFDFSGSAVGDASDEPQSVPIPASWTPLSEGAPRLFFELYERAWRVPTRQSVESAQLCLQCLVYIAAIRRSFFRDDAARRSQLAGLIEATAKIIGGNIGLDEDGCYHDFCRLLSKVHAAHQLTEISATPQFREWLDAVFRFSVTGLQDWKRLPNSKHYLAGLWSNMVAPLLTLRETVPPTLLQYLTDIAITFVNSRLNIAESAAKDDDGFEDPLAHDVMRSEQLDIILQLGRCCFSQLAQYTVSLFDSVGAAAGMTPPPAFGLNDSTAAMEVETTTPSTTAGMETTDPGPLTTVPKPPPVDSASSDPAVFRLKMSWLVYIMSSLVNAVTLGRLRKAFSMGHSATSADAEEPRLLSQMAARVFHLIKMTDSSNDVYEDLELAYLAFLEQFRDLYVSEKAKHFVQDSAVPTTGGSILCAGLIGLTPTSATTLRSIDFAGGGGVMPSSSVPASTPPPTGENFLSSSKLMNVLIEKIILNLKLRAQSEAIIKRTLTFFSQSVNGVTIVHASRRFPSFVISGQLFLESPLIKALLQDHQDASLRFLQVPKYGRLRTLYYAVLSKLAFMIPTRTDVESLADLVKPFEADFAFFAADVANGTLSLAPAHRQKVIDLARSLRGVLSSCLSPQTYDWAFNWLVNKPKVPGQSRIDLFLATLDAAWDDYNVTTPVLKFFSEFLFNRTDRVSFGASSPNGIFLFKIASSVVIKYGQKILSWTPSATDIYRSKYKGIAACVNCYCNAIGGRYTNFGIFEVYNDDTLLQSLRTSLQLCLSIPYEDLQAYLKTMRPIYALLLAAVSEFMDQLIQLPPATLAKLLKFCEDGICCFDTGINMECYATIDKVVTFINTHQNDSETIGQAVRNFLGEEPQALRRILQLIFQLLFSGDTSSWGTAQPLLTLIVMFPDEFLQVQEQMLRLQPADRQATLKSCFDDLMTGVENNTSPGNKDIFTRNLYTFSTAVRNAFS